MEKNKYMVEYIQNGKYKVVFISACSPIAAGIISKKNHVYDVSNISGVKPDIIKAYIKELAKMNIANIL